MAAMTETNTQPVRVPEDSSWENCVGIFKTMDKMMGSAFHAKVQAMRIARKRYFEKHGKNAGFVKKFAEDVGVSYDYARKINRIEQTFVQCTAQNFSFDAAQRLLTLPEDDREAFLEDHGDAPVTVTDVKAFKEERKPAPIVTTYEPQEEEGEQAEVIEAVQKPRENRVIEDNSDIDSVFAHLMLAASQMRKRHIRSRSQELTDRLHRRLTLEDPLGTEFEGLTLLIEALNPIIDLVESNKKAIPERTLQ